MSNSTLSKIYHLLNEIFHVEEEKQHSVINENQLLELAEQLSLKLSKEKKITDSIISRLKENKEINDFFENEENNQLNSILKALNYYQQKTIELKNLNVSLEKKNLEAIERENRLDEAQKIAKIGSWEIRIDTNETIWSKELYSIFEITPSIDIDLVQEFKNKIHPDDLAFFESMSSFNPHNPNFTQEFRIICKSKVKTILATIYSSFEKGKNRHTLGTFQDITEQNIAQQKQLELEQIETTNKKKIIEAILLTKEKEQKRIAEELHDDIGSSLMVFKFAVHKLKIAEEEKKDLNNSISAVVQKIRTISNELSPNILQEFGLINALKHYCSHIEKSTSLNVFFDTILEDSPFLTNEEEISVYRVVQEVINNILKYAEANTIYININNTDNLFSLTIEDDGNGFIPSKENRSKTTLGLLNIESRIDYINGTIKYRKNIPKGTIVLISKKTY